ncbi:MAG: ABC transporter permease [Thermomicrobiales bacterium]|nr:ABC transporter permease [Thermomicrobiales bacterium]
MVIDTNLAATSPDSGRAAPRATIRPSALEPELQQAAQPSHSLWRDTAQRLLHDRAAMAGLLIVLLLVVVAIAAPAIVPHPPNDQSFRIKLKPPSGEHLFGTDEFGRDIFSRVLVGTRVALFVGIVPVVAAMIAGVALGLIAGYYGGLTDQITMRVIDVLLAFPWLLLAIGIMAILGPGVENVVIAVAIVNIPAFARIVRGSVLSIKEKEFVEAARAMGQPDHTIISRHVLANAWAPIIVLATLSIGQAIIYAAGLSFIGLGTQPPNADWGVMLTSGREYLRDAPWLGFFPGLAILITVLAFNLFGDGLRDALDPRLR